ncbi:hypothetical protein AGMMS50239_39060 [Bacteroidia bacterium]|nr:hypothetical protein AGMMS50239_39060 [Bacteroidia bacterium]
MINSYGIKMSLISLLLIVMNSFGQSKGDPFTPYLTNVPPKIVEDLGTETRPDGIKIHRFIFLSRTIETPTGQEPSHVFAAIAHPVGNGPFPALLRLHGGGGIADIESAVSSARQGYVSLVLDIPGVTGNNKHPRGKGEWEKRAKIAASPDATYSCLFDGVLASVQCIYLLQAQPDVNISKIGVAGSSWGGYIATMVASIADKDIAATWSVFGSGNFLEGAYEKPYIEKLPPQEREEWIKYLEPGTRAQNITKPFFVSSASNDRYWSWMAIQATLSTMKGPTNQLYSPNTNHLIKCPGGSPITPFFNQYLKNGKVMPKVQLDKLERLPDGRVHVVYHIDNAIHPVNHKVYYTFPSIQPDWIERKWFDVDAVSSSSGYEATLPSETALQSVDLYVTITDCNPDLGQDSTTVCSFVQKMDNIDYINEPLKVAQLIGNKLIKETPFKYRMEVNPNNGALNSIQNVDFGRSLGIGKPGVAYAYTCLTAREDMEMDLQLEHNDGCKIWLNKQVVYEKKGNRKIHLNYDERSIEMSQTFHLALKKGKNELLVKSETAGDEWRVYLQPPSQKGSVTKEPIQYPGIGLKQVAGIDDKITDLTNWLIIGPFANPLQGNERNGLNITYPPEQELIFGNMYVGAEAPISWTIPKIEIVGNVINPLPWGTNYNWNYHNGGVAWAMQCLSEITGEKKYAGYAADFCEFQLKSIPFVTYQVSTLNAFHSANNLLINSPLLDFTLAPSLPFIYRLRTLNDFPMRKDYTAFIDKMNKYAKEEQIRLPEVNVYTRTTPVKYTTWTDDMFMGIPYQVQASQYVQDAKEKKAFLDDAAKQVIGFNSQVWDEEADLYMHARYFESDTKFPYWSRANGWGIWAITEVLSALPKNHPEYKKILNYYKKHVASLVKLQDESGFWFNVLDSPDSPKEVSGTAIFTMAIARGVINGWLPEKTFRPIAIKGWNALKSKIEPDGSVHDICYGTMCSEDVEYYKNRPFYVNDTHGLFAVLFAGIEMHKMINK